MAADKFQKATDETASRGVVDGHYRPELRAIDLTREIAGPDVTDFVAVQHEVVSCAVLMRNEIGKIAGVIFRHPGEQGEIAVDGVGQEGEFRTGNKKEQTIAVGLMIRAEQRGEKVRTSDVSRRREPLQRGVGLVADFQRFHISTMGRPALPCNAEHCFRPGNVCNPCPGFPDLGPPDHGGRIVVQLYSSLRFTRRCRMRTRIKICCIRTNDEAQLAVKLGADAIGFVAQRPPSPRTISDAEIATITPLVPPPVATFLLTSERTAEAISAQVQLTRPTAVQILPHLTPAESARLARMEPHVRRVQVIHVEGPEAIELISVYAPHVHAFLLDSGKPNAAIPEYGGTGQKHDWAVSAEFVKASPLPVFLAGGLSAENAAAAIKQVRPYGLDLCTGVRTQGHLDPDKLRRFMLAVRQADAS